jgi:hypothetical protein
VNDGQALGDTPEEIDSLVDPEPRPLRAVRIPVPLEGLAGHSLHHQIRDAAVLADGVDAYDARVSKRSQCTRLLVQ